MLERPGANIIDENSAPKTAQDLVPRVATIPITRPDLGGWIKVHWWFWIPIAAVVLISLYGLFRWASQDPGIDPDIARDRFRAAQDWRGLRRSAIDAPDRHH